MKAKMNAKLSMATRFVGVVRPISKGSEVPTPAWVKPVIIETTKGRAIKNTIVGKCKALKLEATASLAPVDSKMLAK